VRTLLSKLAVALAVVGLASAAGPQSEDTTAVVPKNDTPPPQSGDKPVANFLRSARVGDWVS